MRLAWAPLLLSLLLLATPGAAAYHGQDGRAGLVIEGPVAVEGLLEATASPGAAFWTYDPSIAPALQADRIEVELVQYRETTGLLKLVQPDGVTRERAVHEAAEVSVRSPNPAFNLLVFQSGLSQVRAESATGGHFSPHPPGGIAPTLDAQREGLDERFGADLFGWGLRSHGARLEADDAHVTATGDFTVFVYGATLRARDAAGAATYATGVASRDGERVVTYALLHVRGGTLEVPASSGFVGLYGGMLDATLNGTMRLVNAHGSAVVGGERVLADGPAALEGVLRASLTPARDGEALRMEASGDVSGILVPGSARDFTPPVAQISALLLVLGALAFVLKNGGAAALYSRFAGPDVLRHEERERALGLLRERPGLSVMDLAEALDVSWSTASYHLQVLEREGMVVSDRAGRHRRFVLAGTGADRAALAVSSHPTARALLDAIRATPGATQLDLAQVAGISASTASWHLKRLADAGLVRVERKWRSAHYTLADGGAA